MVRALGGCFVGQELHDPGRAGWGPLAGGDEAGDGEEVIAAEVDLPALLTYRTELPFLADVRRRFLGDEGAKR